MGLNWLLSFANTITLHQSAGEGGKSSSGEEKRANYGFEMPLHYPRYAKSDYEKMDEERLDLLLRQYGLNFEGDLEEKRRFAMGAFLWPDQF
ncbi:uncharacterized protein LOC125215499 [Salvia hispanica]|uniref:uncharacterized protein LOC125215499 n=1 Tax=Salvia hispanica TaxID=49212 RepID=UPI002008F443|nr:uncharacterized protein LOC125215499 [Salvia hispanica]